MRILMVEDNAGDARLLRELLSEESGMTFVLSHVVRLSEAVKRLTDEPFDAILLDITLPDATGIDTVRRIREVAPQIPIVILTGHTDEAFAVTAVREGAQDYLIKGQIETTVLVRSLHYAIERSSLETQLLHSRKMEAVGNFASGIAHDFNNTLTIIQGHVDLIREETGVPKSAIRSLNQIADAADKAGDLVQELLMFGRKRPVKAQPVEVNALIHEVTAAVTESMPAGIEIAAKRTSADLWVAGDRAMLERVLLNLLFNARDAMPDGGRIVLSAIAEIVGEARTQDHQDSRPGEFICIRVSDTGIGMDMETTSRIFEPFFTTKKSGKGSGLGLATSYGILNRHRGWIEVDSRPGDGTTFSIYLPPADPGFGKQYRDH